MGYDGQVPEEKCLELKKSMAKKAKLTPKIFGKRMWNNHGRHSQWWGLSPGIFGVKCHSVLSRHSQPRGRRRSWTSPLPTSTQYSHVCFAPQRFRRRIIASISMRPLPGAQAPMRTRCPAECLSAMPQSSRPLHHWQCSAYRPPSAVTTPECSLPDAAASKQAANATCLDAVAAHAPIR